MSHRKRVKRAARKLAARALFERFQLARERRRAEILSQSTYTWRLPESGFTAPRIRYLTRSDVLQRLDKISLSIRGNTEKHRTIRRFRISARDAAEKLQQSEDVIFATSSGSVLVFETNWIVSIEMKGKRVYVGRFSVVIDPESDFLQVMWIESSCKREQRMYVTAGEFCFGDGETQKFLLDLSRAGEHLAAAYGILYALSQVNARDEDHFLKHYKKVTGDQAPDYRVKIPGPVLQQFLECH